MPGYCEVHLPSQASMEWVNCGSTVCINDVVVVGNFKRRTGVKFIHFTGLAV